MKPHKTIKTVLIAKDRKQRKCPITFPFCISVDLCNSDNNMKPFPEIKQTNGLLKKQDF